VTEDQILLLIAAGIGLVLVLWVAVKLIRWTFFGASVLFAFAAAQGFVGIAAYVAMWVFVFPLMLIASVLIGAIRALAIKIDRDDRNSRGLPPSKETDW
jgi:hypothetical protein